MYFCVHYIDDFDSQMFKASLRIRDGGKWPTETEAGIEMRKLRFKLTNEIASFFSASLEICSI